MISLWKVKVKLLSRVQLFATQWTVAYQAPPSMGFSRQEYWSGLPLPSPTNSPNIKILHQSDLFVTTEKPTLTHHYHPKFIVYIRVLRAVLSLVTWSCLTLWDLKDCSPLLEKAMAPHSSTLAWKIPWTEEPDGLQSMGSRRVGHDWATSLSLFTFMHWGRKWQPTLVFLPGESQGRGSLVGCRLWGHTELDMTEAT